MLVEEGTVGREFFLIVDGTATVTRNGRRRPRSGPVDYFGELSLLDRRPRSASVVSETEMDVLVLDQRQFNGLLDAVPTIARKLLAAMATRLREPDAKVDYRLSQPGCDRAGPPPRRSPRRTGVGSDETPTDTGSRPSTPRAAGRGRGPARRPPSALARTASSSMIMQ